MAEKVHITNDRNNDESGSSCVTVTQQLQPPKKLDNNDNNNKSHGNGSGGGLELWHSPGVAWLQLLTSSVVLVIASTVMVTWAVAMATMTHILQNCSAVQF